MKVEVAVGIAFAHLSNDLCFTFDLSIDRRALFKKGSPDPCEALAFRLGIILV